MSISCRTSDPVWQPELSNLESTDNHVPASSRPAIPPDTDKLDKVKRHTRNRYRDLQSHLSTRDPTGLQKIINFVNHASEHYVHAKILQDDPTNPEGISARYGVLPPPSTDVQGATDAYTPKYDTSTLRTSDQPRSLLFHRDRPGYNRSLDFQAESKVRFACQGRSGLRITEDGLEPVYNLFLVPRDASGVHYRYGKAILNSLVPEIEANIAKTVEETDFSSWPDAMDMEDLLDAMKAKEHQAEKMVDGAVEKAIETLERDGLSVEQKKVSAGRLRHIIPPVSSAFLIKCLAG